jgi:hypothetical protein
MEAPLGLMEDSSESLSASLSSSNLSSSKDSKLAFKLVKTKPLANPDKHGFP